MPEKADSTIAVDILIAAYNEEEVIAAKLDSILASNHDLSKVRILVGSDGSDDATEEIVARFSKAHAGIHLYRYQRSGKTSVVDKLMQEAHAPFVIFTDANVMFTPDTISHLLSHFDREEVGLVGANITSADVTEVGIAFQEHKYLQRENMMKYKEGSIWGTMMGAFGGCYAIRRELFKPVPHNFLVDDFHISMSVLEQGYEAVMSLEAVCQEDVSSKLSEEFRRKVRMSTGNFQNLRTFSGMMFSKRKGLSFSFISHKVLRWLTPLFFIAAMLSAYGLRSYYGLFDWAYYGMLILCMMPLIDMTLQSLGLRHRILRFVTYFMSMNFALLIGMVRSFTKIEQAIWEPTERNQ